MKKIVFYTGSSRELSGECDECGAKDNLIELEFQCKNSCSIDSIILCKEHYEQLIREIGEL